MIAAALASLSGLRVYLFGALGVAALYVASAGYSLVTDYRTTIEDLSTANAELAKRDGRLASYQRMIERRDEAIEASKCKPQIREWVKNPDNIPKPFNPFNQLGSAP